MDDARHILRESQSFLERMQDSDRERARKRLLLGQDDLSDYECRLLGEEYQTHVRRREAARKATVHAAEYRATVTRALRPAGIQFRTPLLQRLNTHAIDLVVRHRLTVRRSPDAGGWQSGTTICVPAPVSEAAYAVTLHEIGHAVDRDADSQQYSYFIEGGRMHAAGGELGAWNFAVKNALTWTRAMQQRLFDSLKHHPAYRNATADERGSMAALLTTACLRIADKPWSFAELEASRAAIERANP